MMIRKKNYWLFSIVLLAVAESTYDAWGCKKIKDCCCGKKNTKSVGELMFELNGKKKQLPKLRNFEQIQYNVMRLIPLSRKSGEHIMN